MLCPCLFLSHHDTEFLRQVSCSVDCLTRWLCDGCCCCCCPESSTEAGSWAGWVSGPALLQHLSPQLPCQVGQAESPLPGCGGQEKSVGPAKPRPRYKVRASWAAPGRTPLSQLSLLSLLLPPSSPWPNICLPMFPAALLRPQDLPEPSQS